MQLSQNPDYNDYLNRLRVELDKNKLPLSGLTPEFLESHYLAKTPPRNVVQIILSTPEGQERLEISKKKNKIALIVGLIVLPIFLFVFLFDILVAIVSVK